MTKKYTFDELYESAICPECEGNLELHDISTHLFEKVNSAEGGTKWEEFKELTDEEYLYCQECDLYIHRGETQ